MKKLIFNIGLLLGFAACAGPDYTPVYFPGSKGPAQPSSPTSPSTSEAHCSLQLTSKLCVKIKGGKLEVGTKPEEPLCSDAPPIPLEIQGDKIFLRGSDFPDIQVQVNVRGVQTPMTINGKGSGDGSKNSGQGSWTPDGEILIKNFSLFINVLGVVGEIPGLDLTTGQAREVAGLPILNGSPVSGDGKTKWVTSTILGPLFDAADKFLLGASLQASFEGKVDPPLSQCVGSGDNKSRQLEIVKLHLDPTGKMSEEPLPEGNILEVSKGTFIAQGPQDIGSPFEAAAYFKATNEGDKALNIQIPSHIGPFYFAVEGKSQRQLQSKSSIRFTVTFQPNHNQIPKPKTIKQSFNLGADRFYLMGVALSPEGRTRVDQIDDSGQTTAANIESVILSPLSVPASSVKNFFKCQKIQCDGQAAITQCQKCDPPQVQGCSLWAINTEGRPMEEFTQSCKPLHPESLPMMSLDLAGTTQIPINPSKQVITIRNNGVANLIIKNISIEEIPGSKSTGQFKLLTEAIRIGESLEKSEAATLPITLPPYQKGDEEKSVYVTVTYLPTDLLGADGKQATSGLDVVDRAFLKITTDAGTKTTQLMGKTRIQDIPELQTYFSTATGRKPKANNETFALEEVTAKTQDLAVPVFLKPADTASGGLRITDIRLAGNENFFEWLDTPAKVATRQPPSGFGKRCSIPIIDPSTGRQIDERFDLSFAQIGSQGFDLKPGVYTLDTMPLFGCVNFHRDPAQSVHQRLFQTNLVVTAFKLDSQGKLEHNPDNSFKQTTLIIHLVAAIDPIRGKMVLRISQTGTGILNPTAPVLTAVPAQKEVEMMLKEGRGSKEELIVLLGALILDPFDEMEITDAEGRVVTKPGDGITAVFRALDTRPSPNNYEDPNLYDFTSLLHDTNLPIGKQGIFYDYDFPGHPLPNPLKANGWRIFTGALSYPGPLSPRSPVSRAECEVVDPCAPEGLNKFSEVGASPSGKGACAFFFASAAKYHSPSFEPVIQNQHADLCEHRDQPQDLLAMNAGHYSVDGSLTVEDAGLRLWGPTYFHNPSGPLGAKPPLDDILPIALTTEILKPKSLPADYNWLPDEKLDINKQEHKVNLTETTLPTPPACPANTRNRTFGGRKYSSWRYFAPLLVKDEAGEIPAGCPESGTNFTGGTAFYKGRRIDPETGIFTLVSVAKYGSKEDLTLAFKNVMAFIMLNGWLCNPQGEEQNFEGSKCFDPNFNDRDAKAQISILKE